MMSDTDRPFRLFQRLHHDNHPGDLVYLNQSQWERTDSVVLPLPKWEAGRYNERDKLVIPNIHLRPVILPPTRNPRNLAAYAAICREAIKKGWPEHYKEDVTEHDRMTLGVHPDIVLGGEMPDGVSFGWILRDCGTEFCRKGLGVTGADYWVRDDYSYYFWDGDKLTLTQVEDAKALRLLL